MGSSSSLPWTIKRNYPACILDTIFWWRCVPLSPHFTGPANLVTVDAILFLAPLAFNMSLEEDPRVNRLVHPPLLVFLFFCISPPLQEDSLQLWRGICENKLLANCTLILFLNKVCLRICGCLSLIRALKKDILVKTLASGVSVKRYVISYNDPNDASHVTKCELRDYWISLYIILRHDCDVDFKDRFKSYHVRSIHQPNTRDDSDGFMSEKVIFASTTIHMLWNICYCKCSLFASVLIRVGIKQ